MIPLLITIYVICYIMDLFVSSESEIYIYHSCVTTFLAIILVMLLHTYYI
nr:MAG TPA: hypothetical protein [Caudoviricetes sp.]